MDKEKLLLRIPPYDRKIWKKAIRSRETFVWGRDIFFLYLIAVAIYGILTSESAAELRAVLKLLSYIFSIVTASFLMIEILLADTISTLITITTKGVYLHRLRYLVWMRNEFYPKESIEKLVYSVRYHWIKVHLKSGKVIIARPYYGLSIYYKPSEDFWRSLLKAMRHAAETINVKFEVEPGKKGWEREISERLQNAKEK